METSLVEYGIQNEETDYHIHVCFGTGMFYIFPTDCGVRALQNGRAVTARQQGILTARGRAVPVEHIEQLRAMPIPQEILEQRYVPADADQGEKGRAAVEAVIDMIYQKNGLHLLAIQDVNDLELQYKGSDVIFNGTRIQVKCDYHGGLRELGGTGNLFLQTHESNPFKKY